MCGVGGKEEGRRPGDPLRCRQLLEYRFGEEVEAEFSVGVRSGVKNLIVQRGVRDGDQDRAAGGGVSRARANDKGLWDAVDNGTWAERDVLVALNAPRVAGGGPRETGSFLDEGEGKPRAGPCALLRVLLYLREKA